MHSVHIGINLEFVRHNDEPFEWAVENAAELGVGYVKPMVHWGRELLSEDVYLTASRCSASRTCTRRQRVYGARAVIGTSTIRIRRAGHHGCCEASGLGLPEHIHPVCDG